LEFFDSHTTLPRFREYLHSKKWLGQSEKILALEKPGEGNMNVVIRITTDTRSFIFKQSRPYVRKYREIPAPKERIAVEYRFYRETNPHNRNAHMPAVLGFDPDNYILLMEDLGHCSDLTHIYTSRSLDPELLQQLINELTGIHATPSPDKFPENRALRELNHQHIFVLPFKEVNGFPLDQVQPGLQQLSMDYKRDKDLHEIVDRLGRKYLAPGDTLLHGDYYPGSWMGKGHQVYIIDPEFSFMGFAAFDLGVMAGHLFMATMNKDSVATILDSYRRPVEPKLVEQVAGTEILRRIIGLAQLPLKRTLEEKEYLLSVARNMILQ
jgi:5-methylthioribose kinase